MDFAVSLLRLECHFHGACTSLDVSKSLIIIENDFPFVKSFFFAEGTILFHFLWIFPLIHVEKILYKVIHIR